MKHQPRWARAWRKHAGPRPNATLVAKRYLAAGLERRHVSCLINSPMRSLAVLGLLVALFDVPADGRNLRATTAECRSACAEQLEGCSSGRQRHRKCRRVIMRRCRAEGAMVCSELTTTTTLPASSTSTSTTTTLASSSTSTSTTTTLAPSTTTTTHEVSFLPAPDVRGTWYASFYAFADPQISMWNDGCGFIVDYDEYADGSLTIVGDSYSPYAIDPAVTAQLGPLANFTASIPPYGHSSNGGANENFAYNARGAVVVSSDSVCDLSSDCCVTSHLAITYGHSNPNLPPEPFPPVLNGTSALLTIVRLCDDPELSCQSELAGGITRAVE